MSSKDKFQDHSVFKEDKFKYHNELGLDKDEAKHVLEKDPAALKGMVEEKDKKFVDVMEDDSSAQKYVEETETAKMERAAKQKEATLDYLDMATGFEAYRVNAAEYGMWLLGTKGLPANFEYHCVPTKKGHQNIYGRVFDTEDGIIFVLKVPDGRVFIRAMRCHYDPEVDYGAINHFAAQVETTVDWVQGNLNLPDETPSSLLDQYGNPT